MKPSAHERRRRLLEIWKFPWPVMDVLIGGRSTIDLPRLRILTWREATAFLLSYGYDPDLPRDQRFMQSVLIESLNFIEKYLVPKAWNKGLQPPKEIMSCEDVRHLLLYASLKKTVNPPLRAWACAVLRVMHTIAHIEGVYRHVSLKVARAQIMRRFSHYLGRDESGKYWLGSPDDPLDRVPLDSVTWKLGKSRESIILKLLHKKANVAETIYDLLGVRIITERVTDVMRVVKYLRQFHMITYPNCVPTRARNSLVSVADFRAEIERLTALLKSRKINVDQFERDVQNLNLPSLKGRNQNPHSSKTYRSVQLTCRQLIRYPNPVMDWAAKLRSASLPAKSKEQQLLRQVGEMVQDWPEMGQHAEISSFFPFEMQIMDKGSYYQIAKGEASHRRYKQSQIHAARKRVLTQVLALKP